MQVQAHSIVVLSDDVASSVALCRNLRSEVAQLDLVLLQQYGLQYSMRYMFPAAVSCGNRCGLPLREMHFEVWGQLEAVK